MRPDPARVAASARDRATVRRLGPEDRAAAARVAFEAFAGNEFYESSLGLEGRHFRAYWEEFLRLALASPAARVYGVDRGGALRGMIVAAFPGFPGSRSGAAYLARLLRRVGLARCRGYLSFVRDYDRAIRSAERCPAREARCYWLMVAPGSGRGLGAVLVAGVRRALWAEGKERAVGFIDASNDRLVVFYRRLGFAVGPARPFRGRRAATIAIATGPPPAEGAC